MEVKLKNTRKLDWLQPRAGLILSIDIQVGGYRLATANQDSNVCIWSFPLNDTLNQRLLSSISLKTISLNVVRWSPVKNFLAIAGDRGYIGIFSLSSINSSSTRKSNGSEILEEYWKLHKKLRGHVSVVCDVSWCPVRNYSSNELFLASASYDNSVCIWETQKGVLIKKITSHDSFVKGVAWDPQGEFLASQSDDLTLRIWSLKEEKEIIKISDCFKNSPVNNSYALRLDWCPDGSKVIAGNVCTKDGEGHLAAIFDRNKWSCELRGVRGAKKKGGMTLIRFSHTYLIEDGKRVWNWATGGASGLLSIWREVESLEKSETKEKMFIGYVELCSSAISDIAWTPDGKSVIAVNTAGECFITNLPNSSCETGNYTNNTVDPIVSQAMAISETLYVAQENIPLSLNIKNQDAPVSRIRKSIPQFPKKISKKLCRITPELIYDDHDAKKLNINNNSNLQERALIKDSFICKPDISFSFGPQFEYLVRIKNMEFKKKSTLSISLSNEEKWTCLIDGCITLGIGSAELIAVTSTEFHLHLFKPCGTRICLLLGYPALSIEFITPMLLMAVLQNGYIKMWDFSIGKQIFDIPMSPYIKFGDPYPNIEHIMLNEDGSPVVQLENSEIFVYNDNLKIWLKEIKNTENGKCEYLNLPSLSIQQNFADDMVTQNSANFNNT